MNKCFLIAPLLLATAEALAQTVVVPNDLHFRDQAGFDHSAGIDSIQVYSYKTGRQAINVAEGIPLDMEKAWGVTTGSKDVVVAIIDDGFFYRHEDLAGNIWQNPGETGVDKNGLRKESNGIDDDNNGYIDDVMGWDFVFDDPDPDPYVFDGMDRTRVQPYWHSMGAMGIIGAKGNNGIGVAGINWNISMMLLKIGAQGIRMHELDSSRADRAVRAIRYAADNGARIINWSGFVDDKRPEKINALHDAVRYAAAKNVLLVVGAGNDGNNLDENQGCIYPQCFEDSSIIKVAEVNFDGALYQYLAGDRKLGSNYGKRLVQIGAIGSNFTTFLKNNQSVYALAGGTSNAGPVVAGVAALMLSVRLQLTIKDLKEILLKTATPVKALDGKVECGGVVNAYRAVKMAKENYH